MKTQSLEAEPKRSLGGTAREAWSCQKGFYGPDRCHQSGNIFEPLQCAWHMDEHLRCFYSVVLCKTPPKCYSDPHFTVLPQRASPW